MSYSRLLHAKLSHIARVRNSGAISEIPSHFKFYNILLYWNCTHLHRIQNVFSFIKVLQAGFGEKKNPTHSWGFLLYCAHVISEFSMIRGKTHQWQVYIIKPFGAGYIPWHHSTGTASENNAFLWPVRGILRVTNCMEYSVAVCQQTPVSQKCCWFEQH